MALQHEISNDVRFQAFWIIWAALVWCLFIHFWKEVFEICTWLRSLYLSSCFCHSTFRSGFCFLFFYERIFQSKQNKIKGCKINLRVKLRLPLLLFHFTPPSLFPYLCIWRHANVLDFRYSTLIGAILWYHMVHH